MFKEKYEIDDIYSKNQKEYSEFYKNNSEQYELNDIVDLLKKENLLDKYYDEINNIKKNYLYQSSTHGINHNIKVCFFAFVICYFEHITGDEYRIIMDGCKYHDVGRSDDEEDDFHGLESAKKMGIIFEDDSFYQDKDNLNYLKAIIEIHSIDDRLNEAIFTKYNLKDYAKFVRMFDVLKDSDGLDRVRLCREFPFVEWLNPNMLRTNTSHKMIKLAYQINN